MIVLRSGCKINVFLDITAVRPDGRHELYSLFWPLPEPHDELTLCPVAAETFSLHCASMELDPERNTLSAAWRAFAEATGFAPGLEATLHKGVPSGAGLGGGSADAAALLLWLNGQAPQPLSPEALTRVAVGVGADVPFFLRNRPALATGIGEILTDSPQAELFRGLWLVLLCPEVTVSTAWAFRAWDRAQQFFEAQGEPLMSEIKVFDDGGLEKKTFGGEVFSPVCSLQKCAVGCSHALTIAAVESRYANSQLTVAPYVRNSLEKVVFAEHPQIAACKESLLRHGANAAGMSGSGASVFGLFRGVNCASGATRAQCAAQAVAHEQSVPPDRVWVLPL